MRQFNYLITLVLLASEDSRAGMAPLPTQFIWNATPHCAAPSWSLGQREREEQWIWEGEVPPYLLQGYSPREFSVPGCLCLFCFGQAAPRPHAEWMLSPSHTAFSGLSFWLEDGYPSSYMQSTLSEQNAWEQRGRLELAVMMDLLSACPVPVAPSGC